MHLVSFLQNEITVLLGILLIIYIITINKVCHMQILCCRKEYELWIWGPMYRYTFEFCKNV